MKILVGTPCYGGLASEPYVQSILRLVYAAPALDFEVAVLTTQGESLVTRARNDIVATFLAGDWDALLFVDADIEFDIANVIRLVESGHPVCATPYPLKKIMWDELTTANPTTVSEAQEAAYRTVINATGSVEDDGFAPALDAGTGFMLIHRHVFAQMAAALPHIAYTCDTVGGEGESRLAFFDTAIEDHRYLSEDYLFCRRVQRLGGKVMVDTAGPGLKHHGSHTFGR